MGQEAPDHRHYSVPLTILANHRAGSYGWRAWSWREGLLHADVVFVQDPSGRTASAMVTDEQRRNADSPLRPEVETVDALVKGLGAGQPDRS